MIKKSIVYLAPKTNKVQAEIFTSDKIGSYLRGKYVTKSQFVEYPNRYNQFAKQHNYHKTGNTQ